MGMWEILEEGRGEYDRDFGMRGGNPMEEAYREGCRHGYERAMREMQGGEMGYRNSGGSRGGLLLYRPYHRRPSAGWMQGAGFGECL